MNELRERVAALTEPDREVDLAIWNHFNPGASPGPALPDGHFPVTGSIDAALALVERVLPEWGYMLRRHETIRGTRTCCSLLSPPSSKRGDTFDVWEETTPLAIIAALLEAVDQ